MNKYLLFLFLFISISNKVFTQDYNNSFDDDDIDFGKLRMYSRSSYFGREVAEVANIKYDETTTNVKVSINSLSHRAKTANSYFVLVHCPIWDKWEGSVKNRHGSQGLCLLYHWVNWFQHCQVNNIISTFISTHVSPLLPTLTESILSNISCS